MILCNLLRVPPIFIMDELFKNTFGVLEFADIAFPITNDLNAFKLINYDPAIYYKTFLLCFTKIIVSCLSTYIIFY